MSDDLYRLCEKLCGIPAATLRGLRDGSLVAVPREPTTLMEQAGYSYLPITPGGRAGAARDVWVAMLAAAEARDE